MNFLFEQAILAQQFALNNKMLENGHITKQTHSKARNIMLESLTNLTGEDIINHSDI